MFGTGRVQRQQQCHGAEQDADSNLRNRQFYYSKICGLRPECDFLDGLLVRRQRCQGFLKRPTTGRHGPARKQTHVPGAALFPEWLVLRRSVFICHDVHQRLDTDDALSLPPPTPAGAHRRRIRRVAPTPGCGGNNTPVAMVNGCSMLSRASTGHQFLWVSGGAHISRRLGTKDTLVSGVLSRRPAPARQRSGRSRWWAMCWGHGGERL